MKFEIFRHLSLFCCVKVEDYIERECGVLVYREFGNSKRLSEGEKKDMQLLVAKKTQCTKEAWRSQLLKTEEALAYENEVNTEKVRSK